MSQETLVQNETINETEEFKQLIKDLKTKVVDMKNLLKPLKEKVKDNNIQTSKGVSFLEVKYQLMLQYVLDLAYFVNMKLSGHTIEESPVIGSLVELRVVLDKMKPVENKLKYQVDKLVRAAVVGTKKDESAAKTTMEAVAADPLAFKPNPMNLINKDQAEANEEEEEVSDVYKPPKLAPVAYNEDAESKSRKKDRDAERLKEKASRSRIMKDLMSEMTENPEELGVFGGVNEGTGYGDRIDNLIEEKNKYEEENYVRLAVTRKEKQRLNANKKMRFESEFENLEDFNNLVGLQDVEEEENKRFRNVLNRKKLKDEPSFKRQRDDADSYEGEYEGLLEGNKKPKGKFSSARNRSSKKKRRS
ncbi:Sas10/Utp3/C1D family-domain-containing protein [Sporodiniella umbellata]|nr:Sas10/Utp3/C1D family-domain-containing protein [Sporodiniella umbellata]